MKKIILLGDSIRLMGYGAFVPECLGDDYNPVFRNSTIKV